jgi:hypothetical protein
MEIFFRSCCHPENLSRTKYIEKETEMCVSKNAFSIWSRDVWNWFDIISISLLLVVIGTHVADICDHSEARAKLHIRIFAVTIVFIAIRFFRTARTINKVKKQKQVFF